MVCVFIDSDPTFHSGQGYGEMVKEKTTNYFGIQLWKSEWLRAILSMLVPWVLLFPCVFSAQPYETLKL